MSRPLRPTAMPSRLAPPPTALAAAASALVAAALYVASPTPAWAGRPLNTEDAGMGAVKACEMEFWQDRQGRAGAWTLVGACVPREGLQWSLEGLRPFPTGDVRADASIGLKWAPSAWQWETEAGDVAMALKARTGWQWSRVDPTRRSGDGALLAASLALNAHWDTYLNYGWTRDRLAGASARYWSLAMDWKPTDSWLFFAEASTNDRPLVFGASERRVGLRWWALPETLGLDLTSAREVGQKGPATVSIGWGWYGLKF